MSGSTQISSPEQLVSLINSQRLVVVNFYNEWNETCKTIGPVYDQLAASLARPGITFTKVNAEKQTQIAQSYGATNPPLFVIFKQGNQVSKFTGQNPQQLSDNIKKLAAEVESGEGGFGEASGSSSAPGTWRGAALPRGYTDITDQVDVRGLDLLNSDSEFGGVKTLFETKAPTSLGKGKGASTGKEASSDWVESDVDEQLMLYVPFISTLKIHTIQISSFPPKSDDDDDDENPIRPKTIRLYTNRQHNLGFEEAEDIAPTQIFELKPSDWDESTGTAKLELRFVKFQNVYSLVLFVVDGDGEGEKTRIDRIRIIGESGEKREMGKLEKVGHDD
ncbi:DUF1000-domain-containing protein [Bimuria novae-zelandiae CBS 107.79]|uniref:DUF1000-domain-containing protein n=1 Tax=Bimuria novae-zelandiae CBS 107.79 TaxID=1447943 RepID=A0A6A5VDB1_9PLEO|nr:DUF1000-domain-containing protein [Bimuria novae-zelandiae CBS 107.79]